MRCSLRAMRPQRSAAAPHVLQLRRPPLAIATRWFASAHEEQQQDPAVVAMAPLLQGSACRIAASGTAGAGRGLFAAKDVQKGDVVLAEAPLVEAGKLVLGAEEGPPQDEGCERGHARDPELSPPPPSAVQQLDVELVPHSQFARLTLRVCLRVLADAGPGQEDGKALEASWGRLRHLAWASYGESPPEDWQTLHAQVGAALSADAPDASQLFASVWTLERFCQVLAMCHINCFSIPRWAGPAVDGAEWRAQQDGVACLFLAASFFNHSCDPIVEPFLLDEPYLQDGDDSVAFVALRDVAAGEELTINYASSTPQEERFEHLQFAYGFACSCPLCVANEETSEVDWAGVRSGGGGKKQE